MKKINNQIDTKEKIEDKIIDWITTGASGHLINLKPAIGPVVADLVVKKRGEYLKSSIVSLKLGYCEKDEEKNIYTSEVYKNKLSQDQDWYLLFVYFDIVAQDVMEYVWLVPVNKFFEIAKENKNKNLVFETPTDLKAESAYHRFLMDKKDLGDILTKIIDEGRKFRFPETGLMGLSGFKLEDLKKFVSASRNNGYAGEGVPVDNPRLRGSVQLEFRRGDWFYQDIYFDGKKSFIGQEIVYYNLKPVWGMSYFGDQLSEKATDFLKQTLSDLKDKCRFGERCEREKKEFRYEDAGEGTLERFYGEEKIFIEGKNIYRLSYQGGLISK